jgi:hypothetical protein
MSPRSPSCPLPGTRPDRHFARYVEDGRLVAAGQPAVPGGAQPLLFQPGTEWAYSVATDVLGRVPEVAIGDPLDRVLADLVLDRSSSAACS